MQHFSARTDGKEWCGQCESRKSAPAARACQSQWCQLKAILPPETAVGFDKPKTKPPIGFTTTPKPIATPPDVKRVVERTRAEAPAQKVPVMAVSTPIKQRKRDEQGLTPKTRLLLEEMKRRANPDGTVEVSFNDVFEAIFCSMPSSVSPLMQCLIERQFVTILERKGGRAKTRYLVHGTPQGAVLAVPAGGPVEQIATEAPSAEACGGCRFAQIKGIGDMRCRRMPPSAAGFPKVNPGDWCGEWKNGDR